MLINNHTPIYTLQSTIPAASHEAEPSTESSITLKGTITISELAKQLQIAETEENSKLTAFNIAQDAKLKMQYQDNLALFITNAQRYSQQDAVTPMIENRAAIAAYSLIENKVIATSPSNELAE